MNDRIPLMLRSLPVIVVTGHDDVLAGLRTLDNGHTQTVVKRGQLGCASLDQGQLLEVPAFAVNPVDSTGAGDSFDAGFLHAWLRGQALHDCMRWGSACGSLSTRRTGGTVGQASAAEVEALLASVS